MSLPLGCEFRIQRTGRGALARTCESRLPARRAAAFILLVIALFAAQVQAVSPRQLVEVADFGAPMVSRDGARVAFRVERASIDRNLHDSIWYVQEVSGVSPAVRVGAGGTPQRSSAGVSLPAIPVWSPDGRWIYYLALIEDSVDVWRAAADGSGAAPLTLDPADVRTFLLSEDGDTLFYSVGASRDEIVAEEQAEYDRGIRVDSTIPIGQGLFRSGGVDGRMSTQRLRDNEVIRHPLLHDRPDAWTAIDLVAGTRRTLPRSEWPAPTQAAASDVETAWKTAHDLRGERTARLTRTGERDGLRDEPAVVLSVSLGENVADTLECVSEACTNRPITGLQWRPDSDEVLFTVSDPQQGYAQAISGWDIRTGIVRSIVQSQGLLGGGRDRFSRCGVSYAAMICVSADPSQPPRLERIDLVTGHRSVLFDPNASLASEMGKSPVQLLRWRDVGGHEFTGQYYPAMRTSAAPPPLIISYYWCLGFVRGGLGDELPFQSFAAQGISALCINRAPIRIDAVERYELGRTAVESVVEVLASAGQIDRSRVGMGGLSFGAEATLWTAMYSDVLTAASVSSPMISPQLYLLSSLQPAWFESRLRQYWQLGPPGETAERWQRLSPLFNLQRFSAPILMQLPEQEYLHTLDYAIPLIRKGLADMYVFPNESHQKFQPRHKLAVYQRNLDWFRFWLSGDEGSGSIQQAQHEHWRAMRERICADAAMIANAAPWYCAQTPESGGTPRIAH